MPEIREQTLIIACGALARELNQLLVRPGLEHLKLTCLPATLHNRPELIPGEVERLIDEIGAPYARIYVAYADCGTGGLLDEVLDRRGIKRLSGPHCYATFAGQHQFAQLSQNSVGSFYLTDFLVRQFDTLVVQALGLDQHPELRELYFGSYERLVYLAQQHDPLLDQRACEAAKFLSLEYERIDTGYGELAAFVQAAAEDQSVGTQDRRLLAGHTGPGDHQGRQESGEEAIRRALRKSYRPRRNARQADRHRRLSGTVAPK